MVASRGALYYPYIHPRDVDWMKGTLLAFGQVQRLVPDGFPLNDSREIAFLRDYPGPRNEPLLRSISFRHEALAMAEERLEKVLFAKIGSLSRFLRDETVRQYGIEDAFVIHADQIRPSLLVGLGTNCLAWPWKGRGLRRLTQSLSHRRAGSRWPNPYAPTTDFGRWFCVHPELGRALVSVVAIAAARSEGLDIVTEDMTLHHGLATLDENAVISELRQLSVESRTEPSEVQTIDQIAHIVLTTSFDLSSLSMRDIAEFVCAGHDLRAFKTALSEFARAIPADAAQERREKLMIEQAAHVVELWKQQKKSWPRRMVKALRESSADDAKKEATKTATELAKLAMVGGLGALAGGVPLQTIALPAVAGLGLSAILGVGGRLLSGEAEGPYRYLTRVNRLGASLLVVPKPYRVARE
jgi:hypothetical protein